MGISADSMLNKGDTAMDIYNNTSCWIRENCFTKKGMYNNRCSIDSWWENKNLIQEKQYILDKSECLHTDNFTQRIYHVYNNNFEPGKCVVCGKQTIFLNFKSGYRETCSVQCSGKNPNRISKILTNRNQEEIKQKVKNYNLETYGVENFFQTDLFQKKSKKTKLDRYGDERFNNSERLKFHMSQDDIEYVKTEHFEKKRSYVEISKEFHIKEPCLSNKMRENNIHGQRFRCQSSYERDIHNYILSNNIEANISDRRTVKKTEMDIYVPDYKLAIEVNGNNWHSEQKRPKFHILEKFNKLNSHGISVMNISDYEYINKKDIIYSIINNKLKINQTIIYARKCKIKEISTIEYKDFLEKNHIQGSVNSSIKVGLFYEDKLVSVMGIGKSRFHKNKIELHRFCNLLNHKIIGSASKLFKYCLTKYDIYNIISYCDLRFFNGEVYEKLGFKKIGQSKPNYIYFKGSKIYNRIKFQKHKLKNIFENYDETLTEYENMLNNGYDRVFDCGNIIFEFKKGE